MATAMATELAMATALVAGGPVVAAGCYSSSAGRRGLRRRYRRACPASVRRMQGRDSRLRPPPSTRSPACPDEQDADTPSSVCWAPRYRGGSGLRRLDLHLARPAQLSSLPHRSAEPHHHHSTAQIGPDHLTRLVCTEHAAEDGGWLQEKKRGSRPACSAMRDAACMPSARVAGTLIPHSNPVCVGGGTRYIVASTSVLVLRPP